MTTDVIPASTTLPESLTEEDLKQPRPSVQRIKYSPCGCEVMGVAPLPAECPTHGKQEAQIGKRIKVALVLDETGSMMAVKSQTISGVNEYLDGLQADKDTEYLVTLTAFSEPYTYKERVRERYHLLPPDRAGRLSEKNYAPNGNTPLYDAIGVTIRSMEAMEADAARDPVLMVIVTDGEENASKEFDLAGVKKLIAEKEKQGNWTFVYLGANQDAWKVGSSLGMRQSNVQSYSPKNVSGVMHAMAGASAQYASARRRTGTRATLGFFEEARIEDIDKLAEEAEESERKKSATNA